VKKKESLTKKIGLLTLLAVFLVVSFNISLLAEEEEHGETHEHLFHRNHFSVGLGGTTRLEEGAGTYFTLGADYEYRLSKLIGISVVGELIFAEETEYLFAFPLFLHVTDSLWFRVAPGFEVAHHSEEEGDVHAEEDHGYGDHTSKETEFFIRIGMGYGFVAGGFVITPLIDLDFFRKHTSLVWGISIGKGF